MTSVRDSNAVPILPGCEPAAFARMERSGRWRTVLSYAALYRVGWFDLVVHAVTAAAYIAYARASPFTELSSEEKAPSAEARSPRAPVCFASCRRPFALQLHHGGGALALARRAQDKVGYALHRLAQALYRPGRCFARVNVRTLTAAEARALAQEIGLPEFAADEGRRHSLAEVYRSLR